MPPMPSLHKLLFTVLPGTSRAQVEQRMKTVLHPQITIAYWDFDAALASGHLSVYATLEEKVLMKILEESLQANIREMDSCNN